MSTQNEASVPDISAEEFEANDWTDDENNGADYELIVDGVQYVFQERDGTLDFVAYGPLDSEKFHCHPELHEETAPTEICRLFARSSIIPLRDGVPISELEPIEMRGYVETENGAQVILVDNPERPTKTWKNAQTIVRELCLGMAELEIDAATDSTLPTTTVEGNDRSILVSFTSETDTDHIYRFDRMQDDSNVRAAEMIQQGESYRIFDVPGFVEEIVEAHGYDICEE